MDFLHLLRLWGGFFVDIFLLNFCQHLLLPVMVLLILLVITGRVGQGYGLYWLVRHENRGKQFIVGIALGVLLIKTIFVGYLLETRRVANPVALGHPHTLEKLLTVQAPGWLDHRLWVYVLGICLSFAIPLVLLGVAIAGLNVVVRQRGMGHAGVRRKKARDATAMATDAKNPADVRVPVWPLALGLATATIGFVVLMLALQPEGPLARAFEQMGGWVLDGVPKVPIVKDYVDTELYRGAIAHSNERPSILALHGVALVSTIACLIFYLVLVQFFRDWFSPIVPGCFLLDVTVATFGWLAFYLPGIVPFLILVALLLLAMSGLPRYRDRFPNLEYARPVPLETYSPTGPSGLLPTTSIDWKSNGGKRPMVLVCASGGGIRAGAWTMAMLAQLERRFAAEGIAFPYHVRLVTGASGGMVGASYYVSTLEDPKNSGKVQRSRPLDDMVEDTCQDSLTPLVYRLVYGDLPKLFLPAPSGRDRGVVLEETWKANLHGALDHSFADLRAGEEAGWRPSLIYSPMMIEDGRRLLVSNLDLNDVATNLGNILNKTQDPYSLEALEFFRLFPTALGNFKLGTATRMSASFPYFSPAAVLPTWPRRRVVDAGYYDNYGVSVAAAWLFQNRDWVMKNASRVVLIQIRDAVSQKARTKPGDEDESTLLGRGLEWLTSPPTGLLSAREWSMSFRNDEQLRILTEFFDRTAGDLYFTTVAFEFDGEASLNWYLTKAEQQSIRCKANEIRTSPKMDDLLEWWHRTPCATCGPVAQTSERG